MATYNLVYQYGKTRRVLGNYNTFSTALTAFGAEVSRRCSAYVHHTLVSRVCAKFYEGREYAGSVYVKLTSEPLDRPVVRDERAVMAEELERERNNR